MPSHHHPLHTIDQMKFNKIPTDILIMIMMKVAKHCPKAWANAKLRFVQQGSSYSLALSIVLHYIYVPLELISLPC